jgi:hypothetical protein
MGLKTEYIVKILQLKGVGRKTAFKICELAKNEIIDNDFDLQEIIFGFIVNISKLTIKIHPPKTKFRWMESVPLFSVVLEILKYINNKYLTPGLGGKVIQAKNRQGLWLLHYC